MTLCYVGMSDKPTNYHYIAYIHYIHTYIRTLSTSFETLNCIIYRTIFEGDASWMEADQVRSNESGNSPLMAVK